MYIESIYEYIGKFMPIILMQANQILFPYFYNEEVLFSNKYVIYRVHLINCYTKYMKKPSKLNTAKTCTNRYRFIRLHSDRSL